MVSRKDVIGEVKKFNKDLDKYVSYIDSNLLVDKTYQSSNSEDSEYMALVSSTLLDVRKELILMRKNLSIDVQSMVQSSLKNYEESLAKKILSSQSNMFLENKRMFLQYQEQMEDNIKSLTKEFSTLKSDFSSLSENFDLVRNENEKLKHYFSDSIKIFKQEINKLSNEMSGLARVEDIISIIDQNSPNFDTTSYSQDLHFKRKTEPINSNLISNDRNNSNLTTTALNYNQLDRDRKRSSKILEIDSRIQKLEQLRSN